MKEAFIRFIGWWLSSGLMRFDIFGLEVSDCALFNEEIIFQLVVGLYSKINNNLRRLLKGDYVCIYYNSQL